MFKSICLLIFVSCAQGGFAQLPDDPLEGVSYAYPVYYGDDDDFMDEPEGKKSPEKVKSPPAWEGKMGNAKVTVNVENTDFISECRAKWEAKKKKNAPEKEKRFRRDEEKEEEDYNPRASIHVEWKN